jgi:hypothetical protein
MPYRSAVVFVLLLMALPLLGSGPAPSNFRLLILSTPTLDDPAYRNQASLLIAAWDGLIERDFAVRTVTGSKAFSLSLVGKDGGEKLRSPRPVSPEELFALVDAMPMRQRERRERAPSP